MESCEELTNSISLYQQQLDQVNSAILSNGPTEELLLLKSNISELLELTKESLEAIKTNENVSDTVEDPLADEYAMFKAELDSLEKKQEEDSQPEPNLATTSFEESETFDIQNELDELVGSTCQAPYISKLNDIAEYYNALVFSTHVPDSATDLTQIKVRVMFTNPTEKDMIPCPYYLDGKCKFTDGKCNFSHGYLVPLSQLKEYKEPKFHSIKQGSHVLAKPPNSQLWVSTRITDLVSDDTVSIKHRGIIVYVPLHDIFPLTTSHHKTTEDEISDDDLTCNNGSDEDGFTIRNFGEVSEAALERSLLDPLGVNRKFGDWEQHTKGIGSKLMAKMGYVVGAGLGKSGEGRLEPVQAVILPPGKSLDHCMGLREAAGGSKDLFSVERLQKKLALKAQRKSAALYKKKKREEQHNVFNIINDIATVSTKSNGEDFSSRSFKKQLESSSGRSLNVEKLKTEETMERIARDVYVLSDKLSMKKEGTTEYKFIAAKLNSTRAQLESLQQKNGRIAWEINVRETKKKLAF